MPKCSASVLDAKVNFQAKGTPCGKPAVGYFRNKCKTGDLMYFPCDDHKAALSAACGLDEKKWTDSSK